MLCPCFSQKSYNLCCEPFHKDLKNPCPIELMRSRFSAYSLTLVDYIIKTTHKKSPYFDKDLKKWSRSILAFCNNTSFMDLTILSSSIEADTAFVTFFAKLIQNHHDASFTEKSKFKLKDGKWFYFNGIYK